jgi:tRNA(Ile)-lysidine synthase
LNNLFETDFLVHIIPTDAKVLVGYSGGADSTCLLHLLCFKGYSVVAVHLDHQLRHESAEESEHCKRFCKALNVPFFVKAVDVARLADQEKLTIEEAGRIARYSLFEQVANEQHCDLIATGHTLDDQVETILFNIVRGTGIDGLEGIPEKRDNIVRPLISIRRTQTRAYCEKHQLWFHDDPSNEDLQYSRCRIRHNVLPELLKLNSKVYQSVSRLSLIAKAENSYLNQSAGELLESARLNLNGEISFLTDKNEGVYSLQVLLNAHGVVVKRALRLAAKNLGSSANFHQTEHLYRLIHQEPKGSITLDDAAVVFRWGQGKLIARLADKTHDFRYECPADNWTCSHDNLWSIEACIGEGGELNSKGRSLTASLDCDNIVGKLLIQNIQAGSRIQPVGFNGTKLLSDVLSEMKLTKACRERLPIVYDSAGPIWVPGARIADRVKVTTQTKKVIMFSFSST